jgi:hypothetical protein
MQGKYRITSGDAGILISVAVFFDTIQALLNLIPIIGTAIAWIMSIIAWLTFYIWFKIKGVSFQNEKYYKKLLLGGLIEGLPIINFLPSWTITVIRLIRESRKEDSANKKKDAAKASNKEKAALAMAKEREQEEIAASQSANNQPPEDTQDITQREPISAVSYVEEGERIRRSQPLPEKIPSIPHTDIVKK